MTVRRSTIGWAIAVTLTFAVVGGVWRYGIIPTPSFPALAERPDPTIAGRIAYVPADDDHGSDDRSCIVVVSASGGGPSRSLACGHRSYRRFAFDDTGRVLVESDDDRGELTGTAYDPTTGAILARRLPFPDAGEGEPSLEAEGCHDDETEVRLVLRDGDGTVERVVFSARAPRDYCFEEVVMAPDGVHFAIVDSDGRLLVGSTDRSGLRLLREDVRSYESPVWSQAR
ncbi:MAG: hypothetical protein M3Q68_05565 [Actinomycetota bacterium]|nr:hypothetical protein [Actinomycetota bacterium]